MTGTAFGASTRMVNRYDKNVYVAFKVHPHTHTHALRPHLSCPHKQALVIHFTGEAERQEGAWHGGIC
jgi:hypothetical protein